MHILKNLFIVVFLSFLFSIKGEAQTTEQSDFSELKKCTVFSAGDDNVNSYRIPSLLTTKDGTLLVFCEARRDSWRDKSRTDIVVKRSEDTGKTWSVMQDLTQGITGAYMDPTPILDSITGRIFLFTTFWPSEDIPEQRIVLFLSLRMIQEKHGLRLWMLHLRLFQQAIILSVLVREQVYRCRENSLRNDWFYRPV